MKKSKKAWSLSSPSAGQPTVGTELQRLVDQAENCGAINAEEIQRLLLALRMSPNDKYLLAAFNDALNPFLVQAWLSPSPFRPLPGDSSGLDVGEIEVGTIDETGVTYRIPIV